MKEEKEKLLITKILMVLGIAMFVGIFCQNLWSDTITHKFKNPSFNGINTSSHYLTIENQEFNRKMSECVKYKKLIKLQEQLIIHKTA